MPMVDVTEAVESLVSNLGLGAAAIVAVEGGRPVGVVTRADLLTFFAERNRKR